MRQSLIQRAGLRGALAADAVLRGPIRAHGEVMDPVMSALVRMARRQGAGRVKTVAAWRESYARVPGLTGLWRDRSVRVQPVVAGLRPARLYQRRQRVHGSLLYFHGGGFLSGGLDNADPLCRFLAARTGLRVLSVDYRLAPEHPFPAAHDDAVAAMQWVRAHLPGPFLVGGDSAGANLAASLALEGGVALQVLLYPVTDMVHQDGTYPSIAMFGDGYLLDAEMMLACGELLLPPGQNMADRRLSPLRAKLDGAAPALVVTAGFDPLRDQGRAYAAALRAAGRRATLLHEPALVHGFADMAGVVPAAKRALVRLADTIRSELR